LTCTKCNKFLIKDGQLQGIRSNNQSNQQNLSEDSFQSDVERKDLKSSTPQNDDEPSQTISASLRSNFTLKDVLNSFKKQAEQNEQQQQQEQKQTDQQHLEQNGIESTLEKVDLNGTLSSNENTFNQNDSNDKTTDDELADELKHKLKQLLKNNQITKSKLDEISNEAKRINNNLKLYLIINELSEEQNSMPQSKSKSKQEIANNQPIEKFEEETLVCTFRLTHLIVNKSTLHENTLCVLTNKSLLLFRILNEELFNQQMEFEKCLKRELTIEINRIEIIEVALGQHYLVLDTVIAQKNEDLRNSYKFVTCDVYKTQAFLNILSSNTVNLIISLHLHD